MANKVCTICPPPNPGGGGGLGFMGLDMANACLFVFCIWIPRGITPTQNVLPTRVHQLIKWTLAYRSMLHLHP